MNDLVAVKKSDFESDLAVAQSFLMSNGINCFINSGYLSISTSDGESASLKVAQEDFERARELLISGGFAKEADYADF